MDSSLVLTALGRGRTMRVAKELTVILEEGEDGCVIASCPSLRGCHTQGKTEAEALANIREAVVGCLLALGDRARRQAERRRKGRTVQVLV